MKSVTPAPERYCISTTKLYLVGRPYPCRFEFSRASKIQAVPQSRLFSRKELSSTKRLNLFKFQSASGTDIRCAAYWNFCSIYSSKDPVRSGCSHRISLFALIMPMMELFDALIMELSPPFCLVQPFFFGFLLYDVQETP